MPRRGENIYKRKDNRWEGRYIKGSDCSGKNIFGYVYAKSYKEVKEKLALAKYNTTSEINTNDKNLEYFCKEWLTLSRNRVKDSTYIQYRNVINKHIIPNLGRYLPQNLTTPDVENFSNKLIKRGLSPKTVRDILVVLKQILQYSYKVVEMKRIDFIYPKEKNKEMRVLSVEEQKRFVEYLLKEPDPVKFGIYIALQTGIRIGELCALKWSNISLEEKVIYIDSTMQRIQQKDDNETSKTKVIITDTKSAASNRVIPLSNSLITLCTQFAPQNKSAYVLTNRADKYMEPRALQYRFKNYAEQCNLEGVHFHTLRHTFATRCVEVDFEIKSLSEVLGHSSTKITLDRYVHSSLELKRINMEKLVAIQI